MKEHNIDAEILEVTSAAQLTAIARVPPWRWYMPAPELSLLMPFVGDAQQRTVERRLNYWLEVCGCQPGALCLLAALVWTIVGRAAAFDWSLGAVLRTAAFIVGAGILGKIAALLLARVMFIADVSVFVWRIRGANEEGRLTT